MANICIRGIPGEERENGEERLFKEIMAKNFPNLEKQLFQTEEAQRVSNKNPKRPRKRYYD